jgi:hypothetical protein
MKSVILLLCLICFASIATQAKYKHKSEVEIAAMTPAQRVDEWINEQVYHRFDVLDKQGDLIRKYVTLDGMKAMPRIIEIIDEYDPTRFREGKGRRGERFDACRLMLGYIDDYGIRLRSAEEGRMSISALEQAIERMRRAGYGKPNQDDWQRSDRVALVVMQIDYAKGVNRKDKDVRDTLRFVYKIKLSDAELSGYSQFLTASYPDYPSWGEGKLTKDESEIGPSGYPVQIIVLEKSERYYQSYLEFKESRN